MQAHIWLIGGRTALIHKKGPTDIKDNYLPITCLPTIFKLTTLLISDQIYQHVTANFIPPFEKKVFRRQNHEGAEIIYCYTNLQLMIVIE